MLSDGPRVERPAGSSALLDVRGLEVTFELGERTIRPVLDVSFTLERGRTLGIVGESGSGKSMTLKALLGLVPSPGRITRGQVIWDGRDLVAASTATLRAIRGSDIAMIFQDPMASLNPVLSVGDQLAEVLRHKVGLSRRAATDRAAALFERVGIRPARSRLRAYPHQFSGGMAQRVMIAMAIAASPRLLLADEPTTALDVSIQAQVLDLLEDLRDEFGMSMILVSHDVGVIARASDTVAVMYAGRLLEHGSAEAVLRTPRHPYTAMLLETVPSIDPSAGQARMRTIAGQLPDLATVGPGCPFEPRCPIARQECATLPIMLDDREHASACPFR
jgi:oligopeptide/dipeptide ABC transporter ATP-binding protein